jgi:NAD(P)-dependent dehydrogenase (short-subunit alcohol dehydrogenase family)
MSSNKYRNTLVLVALVILYKYFSNRARNHRQGRRAVVTGGASGIGYKTVQLLASTGWIVFAVDVSDMSNVLYHANVTTVKMDIRDEASCLSLVKQVGPKLDALINIAGVVQPGPAIGYTYDQVKFLFEVNTLAPIRLCTLLMPLLLAGEGGGSIINLTSVGARLAWPWSGVYSPTKAALTLFSDGLRRECKANSLPIRVSIVAPGPVATPMSDLFTDKMSKWCNENQTNPFRPALQKETDFQNNLKEKGLRADMVAVLPEFVAERVVDSANNPNPPQFEVVAIFPFKILYYLGLYLPGDLGDMLMMSM